MIKTGIDILKIERVKQRCERSKNFANSFLTEGEVKYIKSKDSNVSDNFKYQTIAGIFACKEAVLKALGFGIKELKMLKEIEITHDALGKPVLNVSGSVEGAFQSLKITESDVSISHDGDYVVAICVLN